MKKIVLLILSIVYVTITRAQVQFGVKAGLNLATLKYSGPPINDLRTKADFNGGIFASVHLFNSFYLQPELIYSGQGSSAIDSIPVKINYNYLNVPVLFKYLHASGIFAETGPQIGFLLSANVNAPSHSVEITRYLHSSDFSWAFGLGYIFRTSGLGIDVRYNLGLTNTQMPGNDDTANNSVFQIDLFYQFKSL